MLKSEIVTRLIKAGYITIEEAVILMEKETVYIPSQPLTPWSQPIQPYNPSNPYNPTWITGTNPAYCTANTASSWRGNVHPTNNN